MNEDDTAVIEQSVQILHSDAKKNDEVALIIDDFIIECLRRHTAVKIDSKKIIFDDKITYEYEQGTVAELEPQKESFIFSLVIPEQIVMDEDVQLKISISNDGYFIMDDENGKVFKMKILNVFKKIKFEKIFFNSSYLKQVFIDNKKTFCKVFISENFPICFETVNKKTFVSPITL